MQLDGEQDLIHSKWWDMVNAFFTNIPNHFFSTVPTAVLRDTVQMEYLTDFWRHMIYLRYHNSRNCHIFCVSFKLTALHSWWVFYKKDQTWSISIRFWGVLHFHPGERRTANQPSPAFAFDCSRCRKDMNLNKGLTWPWISFSSNHSTRMSHGIE